MAKEKNCVEQFEQMLENAFPEKETIKSCLDKTTNDYRSLDPGRLLYIWAMNVPYKKRFDDEYIKLVYVTLKAWNMNSRGAKLHDYKDFSESLQMNKNKFDRLQSIKIEDFDKIDINLLSDLFNDLKLSKTKSLLVTFAKTLHFFLPNLIVPIDRKFTLAFFDKENQWTFRSAKQQFSVFCNIESAFSKFIATHDLSAYKDCEWNQNVPKIMDNLIIGHTLNSEMEA